MGWCGDEGTDTLDVLSISRLALPKRLFKKGDAGHTQKKQGHDDGAEYREETKGGPAAMRK